MINKLIFFALGSLIIFAACHTGPKPVNIDLPEEYRLIKATDSLRGYWMNDTLHIEFK